MYMRYWYCICMTMIKYVYVDMAEFCVLIFYQPGNSWTEESLRWKLGWGYLISLSSTWEARIIHAADIDILVLGSSRTAPTSPPGAKAPQSMTSICLPQAHIKQMLAFNSSSWVQLQKLPFQTHNQPATLDPLGIQQISPVQLVEFLIQWRCSAPAGFQWTISTKTWCYLMLPKCSCIMLCFGCPSTNQ